jgi:hypothetical protein
MANFTEEQLRTLINLSQAYAAWIEGQRERRSMPYGMRWKTVADKDYLYEIFDRGANGRSLGPRSPETEAGLATYQKKRADIDERTAHAKERLEQNARIARALRLPAIAQEAATILVEMDVRGMLGASYTVAGTNAMLAYDLEAGRTLVVGADMATDDFDVLWSRDHSTSLMAGESPPSLLSALKEVDDTYTVNEERPFQLRNRKAYEVEVLVPPSKVDEFPKSDRIRPARDMEEVEWLLGGVPVDQVVPAKGNAAARLVVPDPRLYALQKLWLSDKPGRNSLKRPKDKRQGDALLSASADGRLPRHPLTASFAEGLPAPLAPVLRRWADERKVFLR